MIDSPNGTATQWEAVAVSKMRGKIVSMARAISGLNHIGWTVEDAEMEMSIALVKACRAWAKNRDSEPEPGYLMQAIKRARFRIWEKVQKGWDREVVNRDDFEVTAECVGDNKTPATELDQLEGERGRAAVIYALRTHLKPQQFAMMQLRSMGYSTATIADTMGLMREGKPDHQEVSRELYRIRKKSKEFLRQLGISTSEDVENVSRRGLFDHAENSRATG